MSSCQVVEANTERLALGGDRPEQAFDVRVGHG
jgi:hypothetical protein